MGTSGTTERRPMGPCAWLGLALLAAPVPGATGFGSTFYCDPTVGTARGDGSTERPWRTIEEVISARLIQLLDKDGKSVNPEAPVKPGDTVLLLSGWHGIIRIPRGYNDRPITIAAMDGHSPAVGWIEIGEGCKWRIKGLTVSPSLAPSPLEQLPGHLVTLGERGGDDSAELVVEDCFIYSALDTSTWTGKDWVENPASGIWLGRHGKRHVARNNYVLNTRFGINLCAPECLCEGNVVANFSADGIRATRDGQVVQHNVIKNILVGEKDGDPNHDDGIQVFLFNVGTGTVRDITIRGNIIIARERDDLPFPTELQGIGCFDGPLVNFLVEKNVVCVNHWHGITLGDAQGCTIRDNTAFSRWGGAALPWVMLGQKNNQARGNTVRGNRAHSFSFKDDPEVRAEDNLEVNETMFREKLAELAASIDAAFGALHPAAKRPRLELDPGEQNSFRVPAMWEYSAPLIGPAKRDVDPSRAQKDPTVVQYRGKWHVFMTVKLPNRSAIEHCSFERWEDADRSSRTILKISDSDYYCAPQVFYFAPQEKWYLIYQMGVPGSKHMWVACSTTAAIDDPSSWTQARPILDGGQRDPRAEGGLDYWIICDDERAYLFLTNLNGKMWRLWTKLGDFPAGFDHCELALQAAVFEASHTYRLAGTDRYLTIIEENGRRYYKAYLADRLDGEWKPVADTAEKPFAGWQNIRPAPGVESWTDNVSHGELIRDGYDQRLIVDPHDLRFVFQGMLDKDKGGKGYGQFEWRIGMLIPAPEK